jgi:hypothetical protein
MSGLIFLLAMAWGAEIKDIPQVGPHYRVLTVDKNENPQNLLAIYTKLNPDCTLAQKADDSSVLGYYWLMDRERYKRVNSLILSGIRQRLALQGSPDDHSFAITINDLKELDSDIADHPVQVSTRRADSGCALDVGITLGPSDSNERIRLTGIHTESKKTFWPPFRKIVSVTLSGVDAQDGHEVRRTYSAKH